MTILGRLLSFFPACIGLSALACFGWLIAAPGVLPAMALLAGAVSPWHRVMSTLGFGLGALTLHEFIYLVVLQALGGRGL